MSKIKSIAFILSVLTISFFLSYLVLAWTEPSSAPPTGNVSAPLNVSPTAQTKTGDLTFTVFYDYNGVPGTYYVDPSAPVSALFAGNVGIGTTAPVNKLHLHDPGTDGTLVQIYFTDATTGSTVLDGSTIGLAADESLIISQRESNSIRLFTSATERIRIDSAGNVGIGTTSPDGLQVNAVVSEAARGTDNVRLGVGGLTPRIIFEDVSFTQWEIDNSGGLLRFINPGFVRMNLTTAGVLNISGDAYVAGSRVCTAVNGVCGGGGCASRG